MFNFNELAAIHLEITNNCQASCPMCVRNRNGGLENPLINLTDWTLNDFKTIMTEKVLNQISSYYFCGNFGDPILNRDLLEMCRYSAVINPNIQIRIHTNASAKSKEWWEELAETLPRQHRVIFALDGLSDTHSLYRIGTNFDKVIDNAISFISKGGIAEWCFIRFKHNQHQERAAEKIASELGFKFFSVKNSSRFLVEPTINVLDKYGNQTHILEPADNTPIKFIDKKIINKYKEITRTSVIDCYVKKNKEVYIDAFKELYPCCWLASTPYTFIENDEVANARNDMIEQHHRMIESLGGRENINCIKNSIDNIIHSKEYQTIWDHFWNKEKLITCARTCGKSDITDFSKSYEQQFRSDVL